MAWYLRAKALVQSALRSAAHCALRIVQILRDGMALLLPRLAQVRLVSITESEPGEQEVRLNIAGAALIILAGVVALTIGLAVARFALVSQAALLTGALVATCTDWQADPAETAADDARSGPARRQRSGRAVPLT